MIPNKLQVKVLADQFEQALVPEVIPVFHRWITQRVLDEVLVDVADYRHVFQGPGITLVGHESTYHLDEQNGELGLVCFRKRAFDAGRDPLIDALRRALFACARLERGEVRVIDTIYGHFAGLGLHAPDNEFIDRTLEELLARPV